MRVYFILITDDVGTQFGFAKDTKLNLETSADF
jgi:hypothetical protein